MNSLNSFVKRALGGYVGDDDNRQSVCVVRL
jgi:hypothetical protein